MNPLGVHYLPTHKSQKHYDFIRAMQPGILKLCGASTPDVQYISDSYHAAPNALMYLRNVARSEQHDFLWRDPIGAARQHVAEWHADIQERWRQGQERGLTMPDIDQIRILGINEPVVELFPRAEDMSNYDHWLAMVAERAPLLDSYMVEFGQEANRHGYGAGLGNIPSGQPANLKPGEYATFGWFPKTRTFLESTRGLNAYACHEYWRAETGPEGHADWHAWRFTHLDIDCDIDILECGVDQKITTQDPNGNRGWTGHMPAAAYVDQHRRYLARACQDSRFRCATPYTLDGDKIWESFWIEYCMAEMVSLSHEVRLNVPETPDNSPHTIHLPQVTNGESSTEPEDWFHLENWFEEPKRGAVKASILNARSGPGLDYPVVRQLTQGSELVADVEVERTGHNWVRVGAEEWVAQEFVQWLGEPPAEDKWTRSRDFVRRWEGEFQDVDWDAGNWTGCKVGEGIKKGTNFGISACSYPDLDIRNLTQAQADEIHFRDRWVASGADQQPWPMCLLVYNAAVNFHPVTAKKWLAESGGNPLHYVALYLRGYLNSDAWPHAHDAWVKRVIDVALEASK